MVLPHVDVRPAVRLFIVVAPSNLEITDAGMMIRTGVGEEEPVH